MPDDGNPIRDIFVWCVPPVEKCPAAAEIIPTGKVKDNVKEGHNCFDQSCVLAAVRGVGSFFDVEKGRMAIGACNKMTRTAIWHGNKMTESLIYLIAK